MVFAFNLNDVDDDDQLEQNDQSLNDDANDAKGPRIGERPSQTQKSTKRYNKRKYDKDDEGPRKGKKSKFAQAAEEATAVAAKKVKSAIVCGVDFGTTYSGVSYRSNIESSGNRIHTIVNWPNSLRSGQCLVKMPSRIAYSSENKLTASGGIGSSRNLVGYEVKPGMLSYTWFKLLLDEKADPTDFDDPQLSSVAGMGIMKLPPGKDAATVAGDFLKVVRNTIMEELARPIGNELLDKTPIHFYVTVPAIWDDRALAQTKKALKLAGFQRRPIDKLNFVSEPEAAAVAALKELFDQNADLLKNNMRVVTIDIGGGTIDAESLKIQSLKPLKLASIGIGDGGKCGASTIDRNFMMFMQETFGKSLEAIPETKRGPGSTFMNAFEVEKKAFQGDSTELYRIPFPALAAQLEAEGRVVEGFDQQDGEVLLDSNDMIRFFQPTVQQACELIQQQIQEVERLEKTSPEVVVLAGGLSGSQYVFDQAGIFCREKVDKNIKLLRPNNAWGAISYGAVEFGLDRTMVISRHARRWYCIVAQRDFEEGVDPEERAVMCPIYGKRVGGCLTTLLAKGAEIKENRQNYTHGYVVINDTREEALRYSYNVICSNTDQEPKWEDDPGCYVIGKLNIDLRRFLEKWFSQQRYKHDAAAKPVKVKFNLVTSGGHGAGIMHIAANANRKRVGELTMDCSA